MKIVVFWFKFHWNMFLGAKIDNKAALVQIMSWHPTGDKPLPESLMASFRDAFLHYSYM